MKNFLKLTNFVALLLNKNLEELQMTVMELKGYLKNVCALERKLYETKLCKEKEERDYKLKLDGLNQKLKNL